MLPCNTRIITNKKSFLDNCVVVGGNTIYDSATHINTFSTIKLTADAYILYFVDEIAQ